MGKHSRHPGGDRRGVTGVRGAALEAEVAAGACMGALMAALTDWAANGRGTLGDRIAVALNQLVPGAGMAGGPSAAR